MDGVKSHGMLCPMPICAGPEPAAAYVSADHMISAHNLGGRPGESKVPELCDAGGRDMHDETAQRGRLDSARTTFFTRIARATTRSATSSISASTALEAPDARRIASGPGRTAFDSRRPPLTKLALRVVQGSATPRAQLLAAPTSAPRCWRSPTLAPGRSRPQMQFPVYEAHRLRDLR